MVVRWPGTVGMAARSCYEELLRVAYECVVRWPVTTVGMAARSCSNEELLGVATMSLETSEYRLLLQRELDEIRASTLLPFLLSSGLQRAVI